MPYSIQSKDVALKGDDQVVISGEGAVALINSLIQKPAITLVELVTNGAVINLSAISVDANGSVVITKKEFKDAIEERLSQNFTNQSTSGNTGPAIFDTNCLCAL